MLVGEDQAIHWMELTQWDHHDGNLEKQTLNFWQDARTVAGRLHRAIIIAFPKPPDWNKFQDCAQKPGESVHNYYKRLQIVFKEFWSSFRC